MQTLLLHQQSSKLYKVLEKGLRIFHQNNTEGMFDKYQYNILLEHIRFKPVTRNPSRNQITGALAPESVLASGNAAAAAFPLARGPQLC